MNTVSQEQKATAPSKLSPTMEQYVSIKEQYPDALLFYRMGDFFELFFDDAKIAAKELQLALTSRNPKDPSPISMCGMPYHAVEEHLRRLLDKGYKVVLCDQIENPKEAKGLVKRAVTRIFTPGTVTEDINLPAKEHAFLAALYLSENGAGVAWCEISTGHWSGLQCTSNEEAWSWLLKMDVREILLPDQLTVPQNAEQLRSVINFVSPHIYFDLRRAGQKVCQAQQVADLKVLDLNDKPELLRACGALVCYLEQTQQCGISHLQPFSPLVPEQHLLLDEITIKNLEIFQRLDGGKGAGTLWQIIDASITPMGGRLLESNLRHPLREIQAITLRQDAVSFFVGHDSEREQIRKGLHDILDLERLCTRILLNRGTPRDMLALRGSLANLPMLRTVLTRSAEHEQLPKLLQSAVAEWDDLHDIFHLLENALCDNPPLLITEGGIFREGYHQDLDELITLSEHGEQAMQNLAQQEREKNDLPRLKLGFNRVFGYFLELSKAEQDKAPDSFIRRQTLANSERYITAELKALEDKLMSATEKRKNLEYRLFQELREQICAKSSRITKMAGILAHLDLWQGLAQTARLYKWVRPTLHNGPEILIKAGRHPVVERAQGSENYIPNDLVLDGQTKMLLITGPNMAGKSTILRQTALICILAQLGAYVPAQEANIGICDRVFSRVGASDNLAQGQSTFMVEMTETARILRQSTRRSLVILDEIGRGTSTYDGLSLAWAVIENLLKRQGGVRTLFATHYHELTRLEQQMTGIRNANIAIREWKDEIIFLRRLVPGPADRSYGIEVAKLAGIPQSVVARARKILKDLDRNQTHYKKVRMLTPTLPGLEEPPASQIPNNLQEIGEELRQTDINTMTPVDALTLIHKWKQRLSQ